jgi:hypothetical protein
MEQFLDFVPILLGIAAVVGVAIAVKPDLIVDDPPKK